MHQQFEKSIFWSPSPAWSKDYWKEDVKKQNKPPYNYILKCTATMDFELCRIKKFGVAGLRKPIFLKTFPLQFSPFSQDRKDVASSTLCTVQQWRGLWPHSGSIIQVTPLPTSTLHKSIKNPNYLWGHLAFAKFGWSSASGEINDWMAECLLRKGKGPKMQRWNETYPKHLERSLGFDLVTS